MSVRKHLAWVSAAATLLAAAPLTSVFASWNWLIQSALAVAAIAGATTLGRSLRAPLWAQVLGASAALLLVLTWLFPSGKELVVIPTPGTLGHFGDLVASAGQDVQAYAVPVPDRPGLLFLTVLGVGAVAILVDVLSVSLRRPALAGLPMLAIYSVPVAVFPDSVPVLPFAAGALGFLWLLVADNVERVRRFGRRFTGDGRDVEVWEPSPLAAAGRRMAVVGVVVAIAIPLAVPGMTAGLLDRFGASGPGAGDGFGAGPGNGSVNLFAELAGKLNQSDVQELVKISTDDPSPFYLRLAVADQVSASGFASRALTGRSVVRGLLDPGYATAPGVDRQQHHATVEITKSLRMRLLPTYARPVRTGGLDSSWYYDANAEVIFSGRSSSVGRKYSFDYLHETYSRDALRRARPLSDTSVIQRRYSAVPAVPEVDDLVAGLIKGKATPYDKVLALYDFFSPKNRFTYSLQTKQGTSGVDIVDFLRNRTGFCVQYAAALAWLVRVADIPSRVVIGFSAGSQRDGEASVLTTRNLHAWTEVYFDGFGWVPFDATPSGGVPGSVSSDWAPDPALQVSAPTTPGQQPTSNENESAGQQSKTDPRVDERGGGASPALSIRPTASWPWWTTGSVLLLLALLAVPALRRSALRRRRRPRPSAGPSGPSPVDAHRPDDPAPGHMQILEDTGQARRDAHAAWDELLDTLVDYRISVDPAETPRATAERLTLGSVLAADAAEAARLLSLAEERARYARAPMPTAGLGGALRAVRRALRVRATRSTRLRAAVLPPSVLAHWRSGLSDLSTRIALGIARASQWPSRLSPRRALASRFGRS